MEFSVVVPVFNSADTLPQLVRRLGDVFRAMGRTFEIVLVDDGSRDASWKVIEGLVCAGQPIRAFRLMRNHGQHLALKCGLDRCVGRFAITMDDDLQHPPEEIPKLVLAMDADPEVDVVIGVYDRKRHSALRNAGSRLQRLLRRIIFRVNPSLELTSFRLIGPDVLREIRKVQHARPRIGLILVSITARIKNVVVHHEDRTCGKSGYRFAELVRDTLDGVMNYSALPLQVASWLGVFSFATSVVLSVYFLVRYLAGEVTVPGFMTTVLLLLFLGGAIMLSLGMVGEYLRRIIAQQLMHDQYSIRTELVPERDEVDPDDGKGQPLR